MSQSQYAPGNVLIGTLFPKWEGPCEAEAVAAPNPRLTVHDPRYLLAAKAMDLVGSLGRAAIKYGSLTLLGWHVVDGVVRIKGTRTALSISVRTLMHLGTSRLLGSGIFVGLIIVVLLQNQFRISQKRKLGGRITALEKLVDPGRSSSGLTPSGEAPQGEQE